jgi:hypothetical protein
MLLVVVVRVGAPPGNFTRVDPSEVNVAVLSSALIFIINITLVPAVILVKVYVVLFVSVIVCTGASVASTSTDPELADMALMVSFGVCTLSTFCLMSARASLGLSDPESRLAVDAFDDAGQVVIQSPIKDTHRRWSFDHPRPIVSLFV